MRTVEMNFSGWTFQGTFTLCNYLQDYSWDSFRNSDTWHLITRRTHGHREFFKTSFSLFSWLVIKPETSNYWFFHRNHVWTQSFKLKCVCKLIKINLHDFTPTNKQKSEIKWELVKIRRRMFYVKYNMYVNIFN